MPPMPETFWVEGHSLDLVALPLDDVAVRFQAAVGDHRNAVGAFGDRFGFLEGLLGIAGDLLAGRLAARAGLAQIVFIDQVRQHFVFDLDLADGVARDFFGGGGDGGDLAAVPTAVPCRRCAITCTALTPGHLLRRAGIDAR